jgi:hypothetical protein
MHNFVTFSEKLFASYLNEFGYKWSYEQLFSGKVKVPDFLITRDEIDCLCDVKERSQKPLPPPGARCFDPIKGIRKLIEKGREKFREYNDHSCALVLFNNGDCDTRLDNPVFIFGAMLGEPGFKLDFDPNTCTLVDGSARNVFLNHGGKMVQHYTPLEPSDSTKCISAVVAMTTSRPANPEFNRLKKIECQSAETRLGRNLCVEEEMEIEYSLLHSTPARLNEVTRLIVCINPFARLPLSESLFNGPYDERWAMANWTLTRIFAGSELGSLS